MLLCTNPSERFLVFVERELRKAGPRHGTSGAPAGTPGCGAALPSPGAVPAGHLSCLAPLGPLPWGCVFVRGFSSNTPVLLLFCSCFSTSSTGSMLAGSSGLTLCSGDVPSWPEGHPRVTAGTGEET